jgi:hypothetical protein
MRSTLRRALIAILALVVPLATAMTDGAVAQIGKDAAVAVQVAVAQPVQQPARGVPEVRFSSGVLPTAQIDGVAWVVAAAQDLVFVGGTFTTLQPPESRREADAVTRVNFAVLDAATGLPTTCAPSFTLPQDPAEATVRALAVSPDGRTLYVGGYFSHVGDTPRQHLAALDIATCTLEAGFDPLPSGLVRAIAATEDVVYYGGRFGSADGATRGRAAAAVAVGNPSAGARLSWSPSFDDEVRAIVVSPRDGAVIVGGQFDNVGTTRTHALVALDPDTADVVHAFPDLIDDRSTVKDLAVDRSGFYTANEGKGRGVFDGRIAVDWDGYRERWRDTCLGATQAVTVHEGILYSASHAHDCSSMGDFGNGTRRHLLAQGVSSPRLLPWFANTDAGIGERLGPRDLVVARSGSGEYLWVVGEFTAVNGVPQHGMTHLARVD